MVAPRLKSSLIVSRICRFLVIFHTISVVLSNSENTLKVCTKDGQSYEISNSKCYRGAWSPEAVNVDCVCGQGLWVLSAKFCDSSFFLVASKDIKCFKINQPIRRFLSLMEPSDFNTPGEMYHISDNLEGFKKFKGHLVLPSAPNSAYVIRYNKVQDDSQIYLRHEEGVSPKFWQKCFNSSTGKEKFQVVKSDKASFISSGDCEQLRELKFSITADNDAVTEFPMGSSWHSQNGVQKPSDACRKSCFSTAPIGSGIINKNQTVAGPGNKNITMKNPFDTNDLPDSQEVLDPEEEYDLKGGAEKDDFKDDIVLAERFMDNGRDTVKIIHYLKKWIFHNIPGPLVPYKEYKYLQLARIIFIKSCPEIDGPVLTNFVRLFRFLIHEALTKTPDKYPGNTDIRVHERIIATLRKCFKDVQPYRIEYNPDSCMGREDNLVLSVTDTTGMSYPPKINASAIDELTFKTGTDSDTVLETAWKIMLHAHYQCAQDFQEHPDDLSVMYIKLQEFLTNPHILFRWENPGNRLTQIYNFIQPGFKLEKFAKTVDACVSAAHGTSYFNEWLRRPKDQREYTKSAVMGRGMALFNAKPKENQDVPLLFNGKGYCVKQFDDPLHWTNFNAAINAKC